MAAMFETPLRYESQKNRSHFKRHCNKKTDPHFHIATLLGKTRSAPGRMTPISPRSKVTGVYVDDYTEYTQFIAITKTLAK